MHANEIKKVYFKRDSDRPNDSVESKDDYQDSWNALIINNIEESLYFRSKHSKLDNTQRHFL